VTNIDAAGLAQLLADGKADGGMIPKLESCSPRSTAVCVARTSSTDGFPTRSCSSSSPGRASERWCCHDQFGVRRHPRSRRRARHADVRSPAGGVRARRGRDLWDSEGKTYLDFLGGLAVTALGHAHPVVADAIADQARTLLHVSNLYFNEWQPQLAERIDVLHGGRGNVFFANSGAEANECAIKLARRYGQTNGGPDRFHVLSAWGSFHGRTLTTLAATGQPQKQETFQPLPEGFRQVAFADVDAMAAAMDERVCAVMLEPIQAEGRPAFAARLPRERAGTGATSGRRC